MEFKKPNRQATTPPPTPTQADASRPHSRNSDYISINISALTRLWRSFVTQRSSTRAACLLVGIVLVGGVVYFSVMGHGSHQNTPPPTTLKKLDYQTLTPYGKPTEQLGGWHRVSPPKATPVYAYTDTIDSVSITVSQQPLPDKFIEGTDAELAELAKNFNATNEIKANGVKVYVGTSSKGPQSALFIKSGLLILIKSQSKINDDAWARYAESLR